ncbi:2-dehydro-3-deoxygalactonokinase [Stakelama sediminis]|uniref:2-dehydro-3-deoxygalactonokinase n=1 Tax=Stakelama sediminis TaxID=463200 RepID=A0A840YY13_9SPHN|nr:2-dehydro-3-deoxygalactonokinase [Stakelama sediminis]MBB5718543.1 2-dehydro-3-deoxygalactonokinase [Stakelama sediminis]
MAQLLAIDWGTTNRRVYVLDANGAVLATDRDDRGMLAMEGRDYGAELDVLRGRYGDLPVLIAGMAGANRGWREAAYRSCPAGIAELAESICWMEPGRTGIVPGVSFDSGERADVMRGEEVQVLGAVQAGMAEPDALLCQPGTHCKWVEMAMGRIAAFTTAMTGELFALLRRDSILSGTIAGTVTDGEAFRHGVAQARRGDLLANLFGVRAGVLLGKRDAEESASYASGLLIGADVAARPLDRPVTILADPELGGLYATAIELCGGTGRIADSHTAFVAGITAIWRAL